jgi:hypothetical protein
LYQVSISNDSSFNFKSRYAKYVFQLIILLRIYIKKLPFKKLKSPSIEFEVLYSYFHFLKWIYYWMNFCTLSFRNLRLTAICIALNSDNGSFFAEKSLSMNHLEYPSYLMFFTASQLKMGTIHTRLPTIFPVSHFQTSCPLGNFCFCCFTESNF